MDTFRSLLYGIMNGNYTAAEKVGRDVINDYTVDTCYTVDAGWETAVWYKNFRMIIVARYPDKKSATQGHKVWVDTCTTNQPTHAFSVQTEQIESFYVEKN